MQFIRKTLTIGAQLIVIAAIGAAAIWITNKYVTATAPKEVAQLPKDLVQRVVVTKPTCDDTSSAFQQLVSNGQFTLIAKNINTYVANGHFVNDRVVTVDRIGSGSEVACGYLFIKASVGRRPLQRPYENVYIDPDDFGGHLDVSNAIINNDDSHETQLLFNLSKIQYSAGAKLTYSQGAEVSFNAANASQSIQSADWAALFNVASHVDFRIALSTKEQTGLIREIGIAYRCWNPQSGQETKDCRLEARHK